MEEVGGLVPLTRMMAAACVPGKVRLEITRRCNLKCIHCKVTCGEGISDEIDIPFLENVLPQLEKAGTFEINMTGGELFARPDILDVLKTVFRHDFMVHIQTNGTLLRDEHFDFLEANSDKLLRVGVSLYSIDPEIHESITGVKGSWQRTMNTINTLYERGIRLAGFTMLMSKNIEKHEETHAFFEERGILHNFGGLMIAREDGCADPLDFRISDEDLEKVPIPWQTYLNPEPEHEEDTYGPDALLSEWCIAGRFCCILPDGSLCPCSVIREPVGNLREQTFEEIWNTSEKLKYLRSLRVGDLECFNCEYFPRCRPCIGLAYQEHGDYTGVPSEYCRLTRRYLSENK